MSVDTPHLTLQPSSPEQLLTLIERPEEFDRNVGYALADGLHEFYGSGAVSPTWLDALHRASDGGEGPDPWRYGFFVVHPESRSMIGAAGFKGPPDSDGMVEIAYGIAPGFQGRGYATEAAAALVRFALADAAVQLLRAHTLPEANASTRVLAKCGFHRVDDVVDPEDGPVWRWERSR